MIVFVFFFNNRNEGSVRDSFQTVSEYGKYFELKKNSIIVFANNILYFSLKRFKYVTIIIINTRKSALKIFIYYRPPEYARADIIKMKIFFFFK